MKAGKCILFTLLAGISFNASAQKKFKGKPIEFGITLGAANYMGDLTKVISPKQTKPMGGLICRFNYNDFFTLRGNALFGIISGDDKDYPNDDFRTRRNLNFKSNLVEFSGCLEWNIFGFEETQRGTPMSPYLFVGIGVFKYNPKTKFVYHPEADLVNDITGATPVHDPSLQKFDGQWIELQPLGTEGQETTKYNDRKRFPLTQISIPLGVGWKQQFDDFWAWGIEIGVRKTFTDYLDDVSKDYVDEQIVGGNNGYLAAALRDRSAELQNPKYVKFDNGDRRGTSTSKDWYMFINFTITRKLVGGKQVCFQF